tara:strand:+ start:27674 stop:27823 length:150 start_codon:yes stop_codon:yes gene_type:complete
MKIIRGLRGMKVVGMVVEVAPAYDSAEILRLQERLWALKCSMSGQKVRA